MKFVIHDISNIAFRNISLADTKSLKHRVKVSLLNASVLLRFAVITLYFPKKLANIAKLLDQVSSLIDFAQILYH